MLFRYYLLSALFVIIIVKPLKFLVNFYRKKSRIGKMLKDLETMDDYPILGCAMRFVGKSNTEMMDILRTSISNTPTPFYGWLGDKCFVIVDKPEDIQVVTTSKNCIEKSDVYKFFNRGVGLFAAPGSKFFFSFLKFFCFYFFATKFSNSVLFYLIPRLKCLKFLLFSSSYLATPTQTALNSLQSIHYPIIFANFQRKIR